MSKHIDLADQKIGRWTVLKYVGNDKKRNALWLCKCECGTERIVNGDSLRSGRSISCGCFGHEKVGKNFLKHGLKKNNKRIYQIWKNMKQRCLNNNNPCYKDYGDRGIKICDEWKNDFKFFYEWSMNNGYQDNLSIDRKNNDGNYEPDNCRWVNQKVQANNTRRNRLIKIGTEVKNIGQWSEETNISYETLRDRVNSGKTEYEIIKPVISKEKSMFLKPSLNKAHEDLDNAYTYFNNISLDADNSLVDAAIYNLQSAELALNHEYKHIKGG